MERTMEELYEMFSYIQKGEVVKRSGYIAYRSDSGFLVVEKGGTAYCYKSYEQELNK